MRDLLQPSGDGDSDTGIANLSLIERGASVEYLDSSSQAALAIISATVIYGAGLVLILQIILVQARAVVATAGWDSWTRVFLSN